MARQAVLVGPEVLDFNDTLTRQAELRGIDVDETSIQAATASQTDSVGDRIVAHRFTRKRWLELLAELEREQKAGLMRPVLGQSARSRARLLIPEDDEILMLLLAG